MYIYYFKDYSQKCDLESKLIIRQINLTTQHSFLVEVVHTNYFFPSFIVNIF